MKKIINNDLGRGNVSKDPRTNKIFINFMTQSHSELRSKPSRYKSFDEKKMDEKTTLKMHYCTSLE